jgi:hypothetical protein
MKNNIETSQIDQLFLELSQITNATTAKEIALQKENARLHSIGSRQKREIAELRALIDGQMCINAERTFGETCEQRHRRVVREMMNDLTATEKFQLDRGGPRCKVCQMKEKMHGILNM